MCYTKKHIAYFAMALVMTLSAGVPVVTASAASMPEQSLTQSGSEASVPMTMNAEAMAFSVTVPTNLAVSKTADGKHLCATAGTVKNNTIGPVEIKQVDVKGVNGWTVVPWSTDMQAEKVNTKKLAMTLNDDVTGDDGLVFTKSNWPVINGNQSLDLKYQANTPAQKDAVNGQVANVIFTIGWDKTEAAAPEASGDSLSAGAVIPAGCTYTPKGGTALAAGQKMPAEVKAGDVFLTKDYEYHYGEFYRGIEWNLEPQQKGWGVRVRDTNKTEYEPLYQMINAKDVDTMTSTFMMCASLVNAPKIPDGVKNMESAFYGCTALEKAPVIPNGVLSMHGTFNSCVSLVDAPVIPDSVFSMGNAFSNCTALVSAPKIPDGVTSLDNTFFGCTALVNAPVIPAGVTEMRSTFNRCESLVNAPEIPDGVTGMWGTFNKCKSLVKAPVIPASVTDMRSTFDECTSLKGDVVVNAQRLSTYNHNRVFGDCAQDEAHRITLKGTCPQLSDMASTGYNNGQYITVAAN